MTPEQARSLKVGDIVFVTTEGDGRPGLIKDLLGGGDQVMVAFWDIPVRFPTSALTRYVQPSDRTADGALHSWTIDTHFNADDIAAAREQSVGSIQADSRARGEANAELFAELDKAKAAQRAAEFELHTAKAHHIAVMRQLASYANKLREGLLKVEDVEPDLIEWALYEDGGWVCDLYSGDASTIAKMCLLIEREAGVKTPKAFKAYTAEQAEGERLIAEREAKRGGDIG